MKERISQVQRCSTTRINKLSLTSVESSNKHIFRGDLGTIIKAEPFVWWKKGHRKSFRAVKGLLLIDKMIIRNCVRRTFLVICWIQNLRGWSLTLRFWRHAQAENINKLIQSSREDWENELGNIKINKEYFCHHRTEGWHLRIYLLKRNVIES